MGEDDQEVELFTVKDLIEQLQALDPSLPVLLQSDPEGNGYFWATGIDTDAYVPDEALTSDRTDECTTLLELSANSSDDDESPTDGYQQVVVVFP